MEGLTLFACICISFSVVHADPGWVSLSLTGPNGLEESGNHIYFLNNLQIGTPPASESLALNLQSPLLGVSSSDCTFCPGANLFDPSMSSTYKTNRIWDSKTVSIGGVVSQDTVSFGGVLTSQDAPFALFQHMSPDLITRFPDGYFGIWVDPLNETARQQHILSRLHNEGKLMNPVVGFRMGRTPETSRFTVGALDDNDYEGTINWIETEQPDPAFRALGAIKLDGFRGFNGSFLPAQSPLLGLLDSFNPDIFVPDAKTYMTQEGYKGPGDSSQFNQDEGSYSLPCNNTLNLSVQINGVNYEIESQGNLVRDLDPVFTQCKVGVSNFLPPNGIRASLGAPFLRSVYLAYKFPTSDCPKAYYGFAFQKGANRTSSMIAQQPSSTPTASSQCLSLTKPTTTPSVSTPPPQISADQFVSEKSYNVWGDPDAAQVRLVGVEYLTAGRP